MWFHVLKWYNLWTITEDDQSTSLESLPSVQSQSGSVTEGTPKHRISQLLPPQSQNSAQEPRRTSSRSIKRKKFDDEVVESSLIKTERGRMTKLSTVTQVLEKLEPAVEKEQPPAPPPEKKKVCTIVLNKMVCVKKNCQQQLVPVTFFDQAIKCTAGHEYKFDWIVLINMKLN